MKRRPNAAILLLLLPLFLLPPAAAQTPCTPGRARVEAVKFESKLVGAPLPYNVVLPPDYAAPRRARLALPGRADSGVPQTRLPTHRAGRQSGAAVL